MKIAAIDLGTNTFHLIIAAQQSGTLEVIYKTNVPVRLGEEITKNNSIIPAAFSRGINCLKEFKTILNQHQVDLVKAVATSGVRSAINGAEFIAAVKDQTDITIAVIDGDTEAKYIYEGVKWSGAITEKSLIMDIGGGSTEFILCDQDGLIWKESYNIGAARLMQTFFHSDPILPADQKAITEHLEKELRALKEICAKHQPKMLIGSAGAFETFAAMITPTADLTQETTQDINLGAYQRLSHKLIQSTHKERSEMQGLIPLRVDLIVMATILTNYIIEKLGITRIKVSTYDLKMGVLHSLSEKAQS